MSNTINMEEDYINNNENTFIKKINNEVNNHNTKANINENEEDTKVEDTSTAINNHASEMKSHMNPVIVDIDNASTQYHKGQMYVVGNLLNDKSNIKTAIFCDRNIVANDIINFRFKFIDYQIKNGIYYVNDFRKLGNASKKVKYTNENSQNKRLMIRNRKINKLQKNNGFVGILFGIGPSRDLLNKPGYYKDFFMINTEGVRVSFRAFSKAYNKFENQLVVNHLYKLSGYKIYDKNTNLYTLSTATKITKKSQAIIKPKQLFKYFTLVDINTLLNKNIDVEQKYDVIGKIINVKHNPKSNVTEVIISDGYNIQVNVWNENISIYSKFLKINNIILVIDAKISNRRQKNMINNFRLMKDYAEFANVNHPKIKNVIGINPQLVQQNITNTRNNIVDENGYYDQFRRITISDILVIDWTQIRTKRIYNTNLIKYNKQGYEDKSLSCVVNGSIYNIPNLGTSSLIYPVPIIDGEKGYKKAELVQGRWQYAVNSRHTKQVDEIALRYKIPMTICDFTASADIMVWEEAFLSLLKINNINLSPEEYFANVVSGTTFEDVNIDQIDFNDEELQKIINVKLRKQLLSLKTNVYSFGLILNPGNHENTAPNYKLQSIAKVNIMEDIQYKLDLVTKLKEKPSQI